jgi:hypothetical protein
MDQDYGAGRFRVRPRGPQTTGERPVRLPERPVVVGWSHFPAPEPQRRRR